MENALSYYSNSTDYMRNQFCKEKIGYHDQLLIVNYSQKKSR